MKKLFAAASLLVVAACTGNPPPGDSAYKQGSLNNGGFVFGCSDGVACSTFSTGYAADFPKDGVALGSTFAIYYVPNDAQQGPAIFDKPADTSDITVRGLAPFFSGGPEGIVAGEREGYGAIVAEHTNGVVADFIDVRIVKPANLTIYENSSVFGKTAEDVGASFDLKVGATRALRTVALDAANNVLAGSIRAEWGSSAPATFAVTVANGVATVSAIEPGQGTLTVIGGSFTRTIAITVTQ